MKGANLSFQQKLSRPNAPPYMTPVQIRNQKRAPEMRIAQTPNREVADAYAQEQINMADSLPHFSLSNGEWESSVPALPVIDSPTPQSKGILRCKSLVQTGTISKERGGEQIIKVTMGDFDTAMKTVEQKILDEQAAGFAGLMLFLIKGNSTPSEVERYRIGLCTIITNNNYTPRLKTNHPNIVFFRMTPPQKTKLATHIKKNVVNLPCMSAEKATIMVKVQLKAAQDSVVFVPESGKYDPVMMRDFPQKIFEISKQCGFEAHITDTEKQIVECRPVPQSPRRSRERITVKLPSFDADTAEDVIRKQLESDFRGIVVFEAEKKFFSKSQMKNYPRRILDLCKEYGFRARIVDPLTDSVECDMPGERRPMVYQLPADDRIVLVTVNKSLTTDRAAVFKPSAGEFSPSLENLIIAACTDAGKRAVKNADNSISWSTPKPTNTHKILVPLSTVDSAAAESLIRTHLDSDFTGILVFKPAHGVFSSTLMQEYPERILQICEEYGYEADLQANQLVVCDKGKKMAEKTVELPSNEEESDAIVMSELLSGVRQTVLFYLAEEERQKKVVATCQGFGYDASIVDSHTVQCTMKPVVVPLPATDKASLEYIVRKQIFGVTGCVCKFVPEDDAETESEVVRRKFKERIISVCKDCGCVPHDSPSDVVFVLCKTRRTRRSLPRDMSPTKMAILSESTHVTVALPTFDAKAAESLVRAQLDSGFVGTVQFRPRSYKYSESMMKGWPQRLFEIIEEFGYKGYFVNEVSQIVECEMTGEKSRRHSSL